MDGDFGDSSPVPGRCVCNESEASDGFLTIGGSEVVGSTRGDLFVASVS